MYITQRAASFGIFLSVVLQVVSLTATPAPPLLNVSIARPVVVPPPTLTDLHKRNEYGDDPRCDTVRHEIEMYGYQADHGVPIWVQYSLCFNEHLAVTFCEWYDYFGVPYSITRREECEVWEECISIGVGRFSISWCEPLANLVFWDAPDNGPSEGAIQFSLPAGGTSKVYVVNIYWNPVTGNNKTMATTEFITVFDGKVRGQFFNTHQAASDPVVLANSDEFSLLVAGQPYGGKSRTKIVSFFTGG